VLSEFLQAEIFDDIFERTFNVSFCAGNKKQFLKYIKDPDLINEKPAVLIEYNPETKLLS
jgi:hypothetical protein